MRLIESDYPHGRSRSRRWFLGFGAALERGTCDRDSNMRSGISRRTCARRAKRHRAARRCTIRLASSRHPAAFRTSSFCRTGDVRADRRADSSRARASVPAARTRVGRQRERQVAPPNQGAERAGSVARGDLEVHLPGRMQRRCGITCDARCLDRTAVRG